MKNIIMESGQNKANLNLLSKRELEVLNLLAQGYSYKMIAGEMAISTSTVPSFIKRIYAKLQVRSATGAVAKAFLGKGLQGGVP